MAVLFSDLVRHCETRELPTEHQVWTTQPWQIQVRGATVLEKHIHCKTSKVFKLEETSAAVFFWNNHCLGPCMKVCIQK